jgi:hypothetical protein
VSGPCADIGVLLVHGIGDHQEGETLTSFGEPLVDWMREWLTGKRRTAKQGSAQEQSAIQIGEAQLRALRTEAESPAYAAATLTAPATAGGAATQESWLLCEAWWGSSVQPPNSLRLLLWMWSRAPLLIYWHFYIGLKRSDGDEPHPGNVFRLILAFVLASITQLIVSVALGLWLIPIGPWRRAVITAVRAMTLTLGDSYVLLEFDIQRGALIERVKRTLQWLAGRVDQVVVVAHSQGGAIAHEALRYAGVDNVKLFASVGSGFEKLQFLREVRESQRGLAPAALLLPLIGISAALFYWGDQRIVTALAFIAGFAALVTMIVLGASMRSCREILFGRRGDSELRVAAWADFYASHDAVPMGERSLFTGADFVKRFGIFNERSLVGDHVDYFSNRCSFVFRLWHAMACLSKLQIFAPGDSDRLRRHERAYEYRAKVLSICRLATVAACVFILIQAHAALATLGGTVIQALQKSPVADVMKPLNMVGNGVEWLLKNAGASDVTASQIAASIFAGVALIGTTFVWWVAYRSIWRARVVSRWRKAARGADALDSRAAWATHLAECAMFLLLGCLPLGVAVLQALSPDALTAQSLASIASALLGSLLIAIGAAYFVAGPWVARVTWRESAGEPLFGRLTGPVFALFFGVLIIAAGAWVWQDVPESLLAGCYVLGGFGWPAFALVSYRAQLGMKWLLFVCLAPIVMTAVMALRQSLIAILQGGTGNLTGVDPFSDLELLRGAELAIPIFYPLSLVAFVLALAATQRKAIGTAIATQAKRLWQEVKRATAPASRTSE